MYSVLFGPENLEFMTLGCDSGNEIEKNRFFFPCPSSLCSLSLPSLLFFSPFFSPFNFPHFSLPNFSFFLFFFLYWKSNLCQAFYWIIGNAVRNMAEIKLVLMELTSFWSLITLWMLTNVGEEKRVICAYQGNLSYFGKIRNSWAEGEREREKENFKESIGCRIDLVEPLKSEKEIMPTFWDCDWKEWPTWKTQEGGEGELAFKWRWVSWFGSCWVKCWQLWVS